MNAKIMSGKYVQEKVFSNVKKRIDLLRRKNSIPNLVVIQVGNNNASSIYIKHKTNVAKKLGIKLTNIKLDQTTSFDELKKIILELNIDESVNGVLVQFPLPTNFNEGEIIRLISPEKDVDGLNPLNQGLNFTRSKDFFTKPCTPLGIIKMLKTYKIDLIGKKVVVVGRSNIVGRPLSNMLIDENASVTVLHTRTKKRDFNQFIKSADIIVMAAGVMDLISPEMVQDNVIIIDVGIHRTARGKIRGDVDYKEFLDKASWITPVPGGVGPMTIAMLMENIVSLTENQMKQTR